MRRIRPLTTILLCLLLITTVACMGDEDDSEGDNAEASPTLELTAEGVLEQARNEWSATESARFALEVDGEAFLDTDETIRLLSAEGDIKRPDSVTASARVDVQITTVDISLIAVAGDIYMTNLLSGRWEEAPDDFSYDPSILFDDDDGIGPIMTELDAPELDGEEAVNGAQAHRVTGTVGAATVEEVTAGAIAGDDIEVTLWIAVEDAKLLRVVLTEPEGVREEPATWTLTLSEHNKDVTIEPPQV